MEEYREYMKKAREKGDILWRYRQEKENQVKLERGLELTGDSDEIKKANFLFEECKRKGIYKRIFMKVYNIKIKTYNKEKRKELGATGTIYAELKEEYQNAKDLIAFLEEEIKESVSQISVEEIQQEIERKEKEYENIDLWKGDHKSKRAKKGEEESKNQRTLLDF